MNLFLFFGLLFPFFLSSDFITEPPAARAKIVFLVSKDPLNYQADETIPLFADYLKAKGKYRIRVIEAQGPRTSAHIPHISAVKNADLLVIFCRRLALRPEQMDVLKQHFIKGKPIVGFRTANHGFSVREPLPEGYVDWWEFVPEVLGCENRGYEPEELGTLVRVIPEKKDHPILQEIQVDHWRSNGQVYKVAPLVDPKAEVLLTGSTDNVTEPFAWTRKTRHGGKVFYTALGYPDDFDEPFFIRLAENGIQWALEP